MADPAPTPRRRRLRFSLRGLSLLILAIGCALGYIVHVIRSAEHQRRLVAAIEGARGSVAYDWQYRAGGLEPRPAPPRWLARRIGVDYFADITRVDLGRPSDDLLAGIASLDRLEYLRLSRSPSRSTLRILPPTAPLDLEHLRPLVALRELELQGCPVTGAGLVHLAGLTGLRGLNLNGTQVDDPALSHLAGLTNLRRLGLWSTNVTDKGMAHVAGLHGLWFLDLSDTGIGDAGLAHLARLSRLEYLNLSWTRVTDAGLDHLVSLPGLVWVDLRQTRVTDSGIARLRKARRRLAILGGDRAPRQEAWESIHWVKDR